MDYKLMVAKKIADAAGLDVAMIAQAIEVPPRPEMGDFAFPCYILAKELRKAPPLIAKELAEKIDPEGIEKAQALGPYLNFFLDKGAFVGAVVQ